VQPIPPRDPASIRRWAVLATVCLSVTVIVMDGSVVNVALPSLATSLRGVSNAQLQWIVDAYILAFAALLLSSGSAADRLGRRRLLVAGLTVFAGMSVGAALARSAPVLILWRAMMGLGAAMIFPSTLAILSDAFPDPRERRHAIAAWAGSSGVGVAIGPVAGGWLLTRFHWGSIFLVNVPLIALALAGTLAVVRESKDPERGSADPVGNLLAIMWAVTLVWSIIESPVHGWTSPAIAGGFAGSLLFVGLFAWWECRVPRPMLDVRLFLRRSFASACLAITAAFFGLFGFVFMVTQYFQFVRRYDALGAGIRTLPFAAFILLGAGAAAKLGGRFSSHTFAAFGLLVMGAGFACVTRDTAATPYADMVWQMGLLGVGLGLVNAAGTEAIMAALPVRHAGIGSSVNDTTRELGGTLGVAVMGSLFNAVYRADITSGFAGTPMPADAVDAMRRSVGAAAVVLSKVESVAGGVASRGARVPVERAFIHGLHASCWLACATSLLGGVTVLALKPARAGRRARHADPFTEIRTHAETGVLVETNT